MKGLDEQLKKLRRELGKLEAQVRKARGEARARLEGVERKARATVAGAIRKAEPQVKKAVADAARIGRGLRAGVRAGAAAYRRRPRPKA